MEVHATSGTDASGPPAADPPSADRRAARVAPERAPLPSDAPGRGTPSSLAPALRCADVAARFRIDDGTRQVTVTMYDRHTGEVLREIPPAELREMLGRGTGRGIVLDAER